jgi:hypothetical protein
LATPSWVEEYQDHPVWGTLDGIVKICGDYVPDDAEAFTYKSSLNHIRIVAKEVSQYKNLSPVLISADALDELHSAATDVITPLEKWKDGGPDSIIESAHTQLSTLQDVARTWPQGAAGSMKSAAATLRESVKATENGIEYLARKLVEADQVSAEALAQHLQTARGEFQNVLEQVQEAQEANEQRFTEIAAEAGRVEGVIAQAERRATQLGDSLQNQFQSTEEKRTNTHAELVARHETRLNEFQDELEEEFKKFRDDEETAFNAARRRVNELKDQVEKTVGAIGTTATAEWYKVHAEEQRKTANIWRKVAIALFVLAFAVVAYSAFFSASEADSWKATILKSTATASLIAGALYASRESGKHREAEFQSKKTELTLRALDPFIATIGEKPREKLRQEAARRVFSLDNGYVPNEVAEDDEDTPIEA